MTTKKKILRVFVNTDLNTDVEIHEWKLAGDANDYSRVDVQTEYLCYSTILDELEPKLETWEVDADGQLLAKPIATILLPFVKGLVNLEYDQI